MLRHHNRIFYFIEWIFDVINSLSKYKLWFYLSWTDLKLRYRGSTLGVFWGTGLFLIFVLAIGFVYSQVFNIPTNEYIPHLTVSYLFWSVFSQSLQEAPDTFLQNKYLMHQINLPLSLYSMRILMRNIFIFLHNFLVFIGVAIYYKLSFSLENTLIFLPALILFFCIIFLISVNLAVLGARFRDTVPIFAALLQLLFIVSPIMYKTNFLQGKSQLGYLNYNPLIYILDIVRLPLLNMPIPLYSWFYCLGLAILLTIVSMIVYFFTNRKITLWI